MRKKRNVDNYKRKLITDILISFGFGVAIIGIFILIVFFVFGKPHYALAQQSPTLQIVNAVRQQHNAPPLVEIVVLDKSAYLKAEDMTVHNYFSHTDSKGRPFYYFILDGGFRYAGVPAGEDLGHNYNDDLELVQAFMHSPEHREILLGKQYHYFGFARVGHYEVMHFGGEY